MLVYYAPLAFLTLALVTQIAKNKQADRRALIICCVAVIMIAGLRWYCDADYEGYAEMYNDNPTISDFSQESIGSLYGEGGYLFLSAIFKTLGSQFFLLAFA